MPLSHRKAKLRLVRSGITANGLTANGLAAPPGVNTGIESCTNPTIGYRVPQSAPSKRIESFSRGVDETVQGLGADGYGSVMRTGLRVPALATVGVANRYLFLLASLSVAENQTLRLIGARQFWSLGFTQNPLVTPRTVEQIVTNPFFRLMNGNIAWHLRIMEPSEIPRIPGGGVFTNIPDPLAPQAITPPRQSLGFRFSDTPALLYETTAVPGGNPFYVSMTAYTPPNAGMPYGRPLASDLGTFYDLRWPWNSASAWSGSLDIPIDGPARIDFYASVQQSALPRTALTPPATPLNFPGGLSDEEQFLLNFPEATIWAVGGALIALLEDDRC